MDSRIEALWEYIRNSTDTVAVTGAGISVSSGGMTFSGTGSDGGSMRDIMAIGSEEALRNDPERYYRAIDQAFLHYMFTGGPDKAHKTLARLEETGKLQGIITTNVDCLHTMAGSKNVAEIQGSLQVNRCCDCGAHADDYRIWSHGRVPECPECGGKIWAFPFYSHIGLYDKAVDAAREMISKADLILIIGTNGPHSGVYWPHRKRRAKIVQINPDATAFDRWVDLNIRLGADEVFEELDKLLDEEEIGT